MGLLHACGALKTRGFCLFFGEKCAKQRKDRGFVHFFYRQKPAIWHLSMKGFLV
ncbi:hypothetical protein MICA_898 [Micavibrio aeruginosavorus ARL-13]|uniref:Uncharacterized protein n=1 Tax=Micavibrio aeruginosavorus (strain ARL-13) TaxID=856793 RepID=G2KSE7_MICAA|nr:hypothetical protein MICA_898 [Micavibrio aeruginosavorus ARL-13]